jgi:hypothetical protein
VHLIGVMFWSSDFGVAEAARSAVKNGAEVQ